MATKAHSGNDIERGDLIGDPVPPFDRAEEALHLGLRHAVHPRSNRIGRVVCRVSVRIGAQRKPRFRAAQATGFCACSSLLSRRELRTSILARTRRLSSYARSASTTSGTRAIASANT